MAFRSELRKEASLETTQRLITISVRIGLVLLVINAGLLSLVLWQGFTKPASSSQGQVSLVETAGGDSLEKEATRDYPFACRARIQLFKDGVLQDYKPVSLSKAEVWAINQLAAGGASQVEVVHTTTFDNPGGLTGN